MAETFNHNETIHNLGIIPAVEMHALQNRSTLFATVNTLAVLSWRLLFKVKLVFRGCVEDEKQIES